MGEKSRYRAARLVDLDGGDLRSVGPARTLDAVHRRAGQSAGAARLRKQPKKYMADSA